MNTRLLPVLSSIDPMVEIKAVPWDKGQQRQLEEYERKLAELRGLQTRAVDNLISQFGRLPRASKFGRDHIEWLMANAHEVRELLMPFDHAKRTSDRSE